MADKIIQLKDSAGNNLFPRVLTDNIIPISRGGTGASTAAGARTNLGLGSVATENTVPISKGGTGATTSQAARQNINYMGVNPISGASADTTDTWKSLGTGVTYFNENRLNNQPHQYGMLYNIVAGTLVYQFFLPMNGNSTVYTRSGNSNGWYAGSENWNTIFTYNSGALPITEGGTGATTAAAARTNLGVTNYTLKAGDTLTGQLKWAGTNGLTYLGRDNARIRQNSISGYCPLLSIKTTNGSWEQGASTNSNWIDRLIFTYVTDADYNSSNNVATGQLYFTSTGEIHASKVHNAVWNDYAECFPRGEETTAGDIVALDLESENEAYVKAIKNKNIAIGVHSDSYAHLIGMDENDSEEEMISKFIPVGLAGRVYVKINGTPKKGDFIGPSLEPGVGEVCDSKTDAIGICVDNRIKDGRIKIKIL